MSIKACCRVDCESTHCERYSEEHGHICRGCFNELIVLGPTVEVEQFMARNISHKIITPSRIFFSGIFPYIQ